MQAFMGAVPPQKREPLRELFADVGRFGVGSFPELLQYGSLHTLHFAIQVWGARRYWPKPDGFVHQLLIPDDVAHQNEMMSPVVTE